ncbi:effector-associated domain EAD1-containing protein, partial [Frankia sp. AvcI1]
MVSDRHDSQPNSLAVSFGDVGTLDNRGGFLGAQVNLGPAGAERPRAGSPAATPHAASDDARGAGSDAEDAGGDAGLSEAEISELATIYSSRSSAGRLLVRAGLPPQRVPEWAGDAAEFWRGLSDL